MRARRLRAGTVSLVWQFEWPSLLEADDDAPSEQRAQKAAWREVERHDLWNPTGGSSYRLANGHFLVGFPNTDGSRAWDAGGSSFAFEVDDGTERVHATLKCPYCDSGYRFKPWLSIGGESTESPLRRTATRRRQRAARPGGDEGDDGAAAAPTTTPGVSSSATTPGH